jgi:hypothetical protein
MMKSGIDQDALIDMFSQATTTQGEALRKAVSEATLKALQGRELTLANIRSVLKTVTAAATTGAAQSGLPTPDVEDLLRQVFAGMDAALLKAVEANRLALEQFVRQGVDLQDKQLKGALGNLEKLEDLFFDAVGKASRGAAVPLQGPWDQVLGAMKLQGTDTGAQAAQTVEQLTEQARTMMRDQRAAGAKAMQAMLDGYAALVSGVLLGMSEGLQGGGAAAAEPAASKPRGKRA